MSVVCIDVSPEPRRGSGVYSEFSKYLWCIGQSGIQDVKCYELKSPSVTGLLRSKADPTWVKGPKHRLGN